MPKRRQQLVIEIVRWSDAKVIYDMAEEGDLGGLGDIISVGHYIKEDENGVSIAQERHLDDGKLRDGTTIPKVNIIKRKKLKVWI